MNQAVTLENAIKHYTIDGAYSAFNEKITGSIKTGKYADIVVLSQDVFKMSPEALLTTKVNMTMVAGQIVYQSENN